jgi:hypothetical protein
MTTTTFNACKLACKRLLMRLWILLVLLHTASAVY